MYFLYQCILSLILVSRFHEGWRIPSRAEIRGTRPSWRCTDSTPGGRHHTCRPCQDGRRGCAQVDRCVGSSAERFRCPVDGCPDGGVYELAVQISEAMLWSSSRHGGTNYLVGLGAADTMEWSPCLHMIPRGRPPPASGEPWCPQTICVVDRAAVDGSEVAVPRTLTWPSCQGGAERSTRPFAAGIGGDVDLGTLAAGNDGLPQCRRRCRDASCRIAATAVQWYGRDYRPPRPRFPPCMVPCSGCRVSI
jgi:hypothetical protein